MTPMPLSRRSFMAQTAASAATALCASAAAQDTTAPAAAPALPSAGGPDFTRIAAQGVQGVANISSLQVVRRSATPLDDPFFRYFFGDQEIGRAHV